MRKSWIVTGVAVLALVSSGLGWWVKGHESITEAAASRLPDSMPQFFRAGGKLLAHFAGDPDRWKNRATRHLRAAESPNHFIDLEDVAGQILPEDRFKAAAMIARLKHRPEITGMLPYALMENYDRLSCAFYDYRREPTSEATRMKCLVYGGVLAHYTADAAMPLHTTRSYDGRKGPDGKFIQKGIHAKIDAFPEKNLFPADEIARGLEAKPIEDVWAYVMMTIEASHEHVDRCYELDAAGAIDKPTPESRTFIMDRCRVGAQFTMDLWYSAWLRSAKLPPPY